MKFIKSIAATATICFGLAVPALAHAVDIYVVVFLNDNDKNSQELKGQLDTALAISGVSTEKVVIDTSSAAKWERSAHEAFDRDIVPVFNQWIGLPGFAAIVDANTKRVIGCVNSKFDSNEMAREIAQMASKAKGSAYLSKADYDFTPNQTYIVKTSVNIKTTRCPVAHNVDPGR